MANENNPSATTRIVHAQKCTNIGFLLAWGMPVSLRRSASSSSAEDLGLAGGLPGTGLYLKACGNVSTPIFPLPPTSEKQPGQKHAVPATGHWFHCLLGALLCLGLHPALCCKHHCSNSISALDFYDMDMFFCGLMSI